MLFQAAREAGIRVVVILRSSSCPTSYLNSANDCFSISTFDSIGTLLQSVISIICPSKYEAIRNSKQYKLVLFES